MELHFENFSHIRFYF